MRFSFYYSVLLCVILSFLPSCRNEQRYLDELLQADQYMQQHPDSALLSLQKIASPEKLPEAQHAYYCLLLTQAEDKTYHIPTSDSLISIAAHYFEKQKDTHLKARAWCYMGRTNQELQQTEKALEYYLKAIPYAEEARDYKLLAIIYNSAGILYRQQKMFDKALSQTYKSLQASHLAEDTFGIIIAYRNIGRIHLFAENIDSTLYNYEHALKLARTINHNLSQTSILNDIGAIYDKIGKYNEAIQLIQSTISRENEGNNNHASYLSLGVIYEKKNMIDSAYYYFDLAKNSDNIYTEAGAYFRLYNLSKEKSNYKQALAYKEKHQFLRDSIDRDRKRIDFLNTIHTYEQKELKKELELKSAQERILYLLLIIILLVSLIISFFIYSRKRLQQEKKLRSQEKKIQYEKEQRLLSEKQIRQNEQQIEINKQKIINKEEALLSVQGKLLTYETGLLQTENELIRLKREEQEFRNKIFMEKGYTHRIRVTGQNSFDSEDSYPPFHFKEIPQLREALNEVYNGFADNLSVSYPQLKDRELDICYLLKAGAKTSNISFIISMTPNAVSKKKKNILYKLGIIDKSISLEEFLDNF